MKTANLEMLGIQVPLTIFEAYHLDFVDNPASISEHIRSLGIKYGNEYRANQLTEGATFGGVYFSLRTWWVEHHHVLCTAQHIPGIRIGLQAHEETHALEGLRGFGGLNILRRRIRDNFKLDVNFRRVEGAEVRAYIGAIFALFMRGIPPDIYGSSTPNLRYREYFRQARQIFQKS